MKVLFALVISFFSLAAFANCPVLSGTYQVGPYLTSIAQKGCSALAFSNQGRTIKVAVNGQPQATGDGEWEKYEWNKNLLAVTPVTQDGQVIPGLVTYYSLNNSRDLVLQIFVNGKIREA